MRADWVLVTGPTQEPLSLDDVKMHCRVDHVEEDGYLDAQMRAARGLAEQYLGRGLLTQTWKLVMDEWWDDRVWLPMAAPLQDGVSTAPIVKYYNTSGVLTTITDDDATYLIDTTTEPGSLVWAPSSTMPTLQSDRLGAIEITYTVGWTTANAVPRAIIQGILLMIGHWYSNREAVVVSVGGTAVEMPLGIASLWGPYRVEWRPSTCQV